MTSMDQTHAGACRGQNKKQEGFILLGLPLFISLWLFTLTYEMQTYDSLNALDFMQRI